jgi:iron complex transport system ATP-binding protein
MSQASPAETSRSAHALTCAAISVDYGARTALGAFSLEVGRGEIRSLIGPNGSGKSTALHAMAGLTQPGSGQVFLGDRPVASFRRRDLARQLSFLPQAPRAPEALTVEQLVRHGRFAHIGLWGSLGRHDRDAVAWALESTGLAPLAARDLKELSGGERQRAWIAMALAQEAEILLLDEPTTFLDIGHQVEVLDLLCRLSRERGVTVVMSIHDLNQAMAVSDRISLLEHGSQVFDGTPAGLADSGWVEKAFGVRGRFITLEQSSRPHFDVEIGGR